MQDDPKPPLERKLPNGTVRAWRDESGISHVGWLPHEGSWHTYSRDDPDLPPDFLVGGSLDDLFAWAVERFATPEDE
jgi:hypothetical protein